MAAIKSSVRFEDETDADRAAREMHAAATLQAATRAMLARKKSFANVKRQAMASLVIQKSLLQWWMQKDREQQQQQQTADQIASASASASASVEDSQGRKRKERDSEG
jgi:hypothetical protein